jgi:hypothetical protein
MNKIICLLAFIGLTVVCKAQYTAKDVFSKDDIVWYGLDFSKAQMIGQFDQGAGAGMATGSDLKSTYVPRWNNLIVDEGKKYDLKRFFRKVTVYNELNVVEKSNQKIDPDHFIIHNEYNFANAGKIVQDIISNYTAGDKKEGLGVVFIVEYFDKEARQGSFYVTFFDIATKKVLFTEHMFGKAGGFGLRNYWAASIFSVLKEIDEHAYKRWSETYAKK